MDFFGSKLKKVCRCFELKYLTLFMMLISCSLSKDNFPRFHVTCDTIGLYVKIAFSKPFSGVIYAKGYRFDTLCSITRFSALNGSLNLPLTACGTYVQETNNPWITNTVVIQHHPLIKTAIDVEKSLICSLQSFKGFRYPPTLLDQIYESHSLPLTDFSSGMEFWSDDFHDDSSKIFDSTLSRLTIFQLPNGTVYNDIGIKSCIAHDERILDEKATVHQLTSPEGCFSVNSKNSSRLKIIGTDEGLMAYVNISTFGMESSSNIYLTCEVMFCKTKCECSETQQTKHPISIISHKLTKRSTDTSSDVFSLKQYEARTRYLKSTVKALMDRIVEQRNRNATTSKVRRRLMRLDDSPLPSETNSQAPILTSANIFVSKPVPTDLYNIESHLIDAYEGRENSHEHQDIDFERDEHEDSQEHQDIDFDRDEHEDSHEHQDIDFERDEHKDSYEHENDEELEDSHDEIWLMTVPSRKAVGHSKAGVVTPKAIKDDGIKTVPDEKLQSNDTIVMTNDVVSPVNEVTDNTNIETTTAISFPSAVDINSHAGSCIPRLRFIVVIVVMGFFIGCLLMVSCGMALYIRKEKKRNKINDFLLYSIGF